MSGHCAAGADMGTGVIRALALAFFVGGWILTILGVQAMNSPSSDLARFSTGAPTDRARWLPVGGVGMLVGCLDALACGFRKS